VLRWLLGVPAALYAAHAGWLLGHRFLLLLHRGRQTHRQTHRLYCTVLEVVAWRPAAWEAVVVSGFGPSAQWYQNVLAGQAVEVQLARLRFVPSVRLLDLDEAVGVLADYERRNRIARPLVRAVLSKLVATWRLLPLEGRRSIRTGTQPTSCWVRRHWPMNSP
jgi:deazaflavin-dependent oxidoreductase (nitroreductase family)